MKRHSTSRFAILAPLAAVLILAVVVTACASSGGIFANVGTDLKDDGVAQPAPADRGEGGEGDEGGGPVGQDGSFANLADRSIIKTGTITLEVERIGQAIGEVRALALALNGFVGSSQLAGDDESATLTLRIPAPSFDEAISRLHDMDAEVLSEATREEDVTGQVVDLEARIRNLQASEAQYRALLERASEIEDVLAVQSRLDEVRGQIEQLQAQLDQLSGLADLATLTVTLVPADAPVEETTSAWDPGAIVDSAVAALVGVGQAVAAVAIWLGIVGVPLMIVIGVVVLIALRLAPGWRRPSVRVE